VNEGSAGGEDFTEQLSPLTFKNIFIFFKSKCAFLEYGGVASMKSVEVVG